MSRLTEAQRAILTDLASVDHCKDFGRRTGHLSARLKATTATMRRRLMSLAALGLVRKSESYSAVNDFYWIITVAGLAALETQKEP